MPSHHPAELQPPPRAPRTTGGKKAPRNPWGSAALEWQTGNPLPPLTNFVNDPIVTRGPYDYHLATEAELAED